MEKIILNLTFLLNKKEPKEKKEPKMLKEIMNDNKIEFNLF
jgi:hypothetical protein